MCNILYQHLQNKRFVFWKTQCWPLQNCFDSYILLLFHQKAAEHELKDLDDSILLIREPLNAAKKLWKMAICCCSSLSTKWSVGFFLIVSKRWAWAKESWFLHYSLIITFLFWQNSINLFHFFNLPDQCWSFFDCK